MIEMFAVKFLIEAVASAGIGHVVSKGLERISPEVLRLIKGGADPETIRKKIAEEGLETEIERYSNELIESSIFYSIPREQAKTPADKVLLIANFLKFVDQIATRENFDLLLPGSLLGEESVTFVQVNQAEGTPDFTPDGVVLNLPVRKVSSISSLNGSGVYMIPVKAKDRDKIIAVYETYMRNQRGKSNDRISYYEEIRTIFPDLYIPAEVKRISAVSIGYRIGPDLDYGDAWSDGLKMMIDGLIRVRDFNFLSRGEWDAMADVARKLAETVSAEPDPA